MTRGSHRRSDYLEWVKRRRDRIRYPLSRSGMPRLDIRTLGASLDFLAQNEDNEDGWPPLLDLIGARAGLGADHVCLAVACTGANHLAFGLFLDPGDHIAMETPVYEPLVKLAHYFGATIDFFPRHESNHWRVDPDDVKRVLTKNTRLVVLSNLHNPTSAHDDDDTIRRIAADASQVGARVVVDEVYLDLLYADGVRTAARLSPAILATSSMTKTFGLDTLRLGWVVAEPGIATRARRLSDLYANNFPHASERIAYLALQRADEILARHNALLARNADIVDDFIGAHEALSWVRPRVGTCGMVRARGVDVDELTDRLERDHATGIVPGRFFDAPGHFRIGWALETDVLRAGLERVARALGRG